MCFGHQNGDLLTHQLGRALKINHPVLRCPTAELRTAGLARTFNQHPGDLAYLCFVFFQGYALLQTL